MGGSISVNCHGRGIKYGTLVETILEMEVILSDGFIISLQPSDDLFRAVVGGYGGIALIISVILITEPNYPIERLAFKIKATNLLSNLNELINDPNLGFYNGNVYSAAENKIIQVCWLRISNPLTNNKRLMEVKSYHWDKIVLEQLIRRSKLAKLVRTHFEPQQLAQPEVVWRNYEMSHDVNTLRPLFHYPTTSILQEYFLPLNKAALFYFILWRIIGKYEVNLINLSLRYVRKTNVPLLTYAPHDMISFVLYINLVNSWSSMDYAYQWSQELIIPTLYLGGTYYLPYLPFATRKQFRQAYPKWDLWLQIKAQYDHRCIFQNSFLREYLL